MSDRTLNRTVAVKIETVAGVDAAPTVAANAIRVENPTSNPNLNTVEIREATAGLDRGARVPAGGDRGFTGRCYLKGSGTAGTPPEVDPLLKSCALAIKTLGADLSGTAVAATASTVTLPAAAAGTTGLYVGMVVQVTAGPGAGSRRLIKAYDGGTKVATVTPDWTAGGGVQPTTASTVVVRACNVYAPTSVGVPNVTVYDWAHSSSGGLSKLRKTVGACGNARLSVAPRQVPSWDFEHRGILVPEDDVANPGAPTYQPDVKLAYMDAQVYLGNTKAQLNQLTVDLGNNPVSEDDPSTKYGTGIAGVTDRRVGGTMRLPQTLKSVRDVIGSWETGSRFDLSSLHGSVAGQRFGILLTDVVYTGQSMADVQGFLYEDLPFDINATDSGFFVCYW